MTSENKKEILNLSKYSFFANKLRNDVENWNKSFSYVSCIKLSVYSVNISVFFALQFVYYVG